MGPSLSALLCIFFVIIGTFVVALIAGALGVVAQALGVPEPILGYLGRLWKWIDPVGLTPFIVATAVSIWLVTLIIEKPKGDKTLKEYISIKIKTQDDDDLEFISLLERLITKLDNQYDPEQVFVILIKNWFDHKWLKFSDKGLVRFDHLRDWQPNVSLSEFFQDKITFPPFTPNRILSQTAWEISQTRRFVHNMKRKHSSWNLQNRVTQFSNSAIFIWYSSATRSNQRGSLMVYNVKDGEVDAWYASFRKATSWGLDKTKGIDKIIVESMIKHHAEQNGSTDG